MYVRSVNNDKKCNTVRLNCMTYTYTDMRRLTTGISSEKCVVRRFRRCENVYLHKSR
jgi:hypothetical protein